MQQPAVAPVRADIFEVLAKKSAKLQMSLDDLDLAFANLNGRGDIVLRKIKTLLLRAHNGTSQS